MVWLGFGLLPKVVVVALIGFFPIVVSSVDGLVDADPERIDLVRSFGGDRLTALAPGAGAVRAPGVLRRPEDRRDLRGRRRGDRRMDGHVRKASAS